MNLQSGMPYKDPKNPKNIAYKKAYYERNKATIWSYERRKKSSDEWRKNNPEKRREYEHRRRKELGDFLNAYNKMWRKLNESYVKDCENTKTKLLTDAYMKKHLLKLGYNKEDFTTDLIDTHRQIIKIKRYAKHQTTS